MSENGFCYNGRLMRGLRAVPGLILAAFLAAAAGASEPAKPPPNPKTQPLLTRGILLYQRGDIFSARDEFRHVLRIDPADAKARSYMQKIDRRLRAAARDLLKSARMNRAQADRDVKRLLARAPDSPEAARLLHQALEEEAADDPSSARDLEWMLDRPGPEAPGVEAKLERRLLERKAKATYQAGLAHYGKGQWKEALKAFEEVRNITPGDPEVIQMFEKARTRYAKERMETVDALYREAAALYAKASYDEAAELLREILRIHPLHLDAQRYLEKIESLSGEGPAE